MRVVEFCHVAAGPYATQLLADLGADVVKVESATGDQMRGWPPLEQTVAGDSFSHNFASVNRNKRSIVLDLKSESGRSEATRLVAEADVLLENHRPGLLEEFGLGFDHVSDGHRGLIYCSISGYGQTSPHGMKTAYDVVIQGASGLMSITGSEDGPPAKCGVPVADFIAGLYAALTVVALYPASKASGRSFHVDCPMLDCILAASALQVSEYWGSGREPRRMGSKHPRNAPYQAFQASDVPFVLAAGSNQLWHRVCEAVERPDLADDDRFGDQQSRASNQNTLEELLAAVFVRKPASEWLRDFNARGVPCGPVSTYGDVLASDHVLKTELVEQLTTEVGPVPSISFPLLIDGRRLRARSGPPRLGEHSDSVRADWLHDEYS